MDLQMENIKTTVVHEITSLTMSLQSVNFRIAGLTAIQFVGTTMKKKKSSITCKHKVR